MIIETDWYKRKYQAKVREYIMYDKLDRPVVTQDANLAVQDKWLFTSYDVLGRVAYTGSVERDNWSASTMQNHLKGSYNINIQQNSVAIQINGVEIYYPKNFTHTTYIPETAIDIYTINYYDNYIDLPQNLNVPTTVYGQAVTTRTQGLATVSKVRVLDTSDWITTVTYYDEKARPIYVYSENTYLDTEDIVESKLDFTGKVLETKTTHIRDNDTIVTYDYFEYDHVDRLISHTQKIDSQLPERIVRNNYDEMGQLESKLVGNATQSGYTDVTMGISITEDTITKTTNDGSWNEGLATIDSIEDDGYIEFKIEETATKAVIGLSNLNLNASDTSIQFGIYLNAGSLEVLESGSNKGVFGTVEDDDVFRVERENYIIYYKKNNEVFLYFYHKFFWNLVG